MPHDELAVAMSESELARRANVSIAVLRKWRREQRGPRYLKLGRLIRYLGRDVEAWMEAHAVGVSRQLRGRNAK